ncbi:8935_t:CDS:2, partial [Funneliformis mosseae]
MPSSSPRVVTGGVTTPSEPSSSISEIQVETEKSPTCGYTSLTDLPPIKVNKSTSTHEDGIIFHPSSNNHYSRRTKDTKPTSATSHQRPMINTSF